MKATNGAAMGALVTTALFVDRCVDSRTGDDRFSYSTTMNEGGTSVMMHAGTTEYKIK